MSTEVLTQRTQIGVINEKVAIFLIKKSNKIKILDLTTIDWMKKELSCYDIYVIDQPKDGNYKSKIVPFVGNYGHIAILPSSLALITKQTIEKSFETAAIKNSKAMKLFAGYIFDAKYYISNNQSFFDSFYTQQEAEFCTIETKEQIAYAEKILTRRIISRLQNRGVIFRNSNSCIISANAEIGAGSVIMSNCNIMGKTKIGENCIINNNCTIINSKIADNASISNSIIDRSNISNNVIISPYCNIIKSKIGENAMIESYCIIDGYTIKKNQNISARTTLKKINKE